MDAVTVFQTGLQGVEEKLPPRVVVVGHHAGPLLARVVQDLAIWSPEGQLIKNFIKLFSQVKTTKLYQGI